MNRLPIWFLACLVVSFAESIFSAQEEPPSAEPATRATEEAPAAPALTDEDHETLELLRSVLAEEGRESAREFLREIVAGLAEPAPGGEAARVAFLLGLDAIAQDLGSLQELSTVRRSVMEIRTRLLPPDHPDLLASKQDFAKTRYELGDIEGAHELFEAVLEARKRLLPADHRDLLVAKVNVALSRKTRGDLAGAKELQEDVIATWTRLLPADHPDLLTAKLNLANTLSKLGDLARARELGEEVHEAWTRLLPADHPLLLAAKLNLAATRYQLGDLAGAQELFEAVHEAWTRLLPANHPDLLRVKHNLGMMKASRGDLAGAQELYEAVLEARTRLLPADHPDLLTTMQNLAGIRKELGDLAGAEALYEAVLEAYTRLLPAGHPDLLTAKLNLAVARNELGDFAGAQELFEAVFEARSSFLPADHPVLLTAKLHLALSRKELGDFAGARALEEELVEVRSRLLPADHPDLLKAKGNLAVTLRRLGDLAGAKALEEEVLEAWTRLLPADHPDLLSATHYLAATRAELGDRAGTKQLLASLLAGMRMRAEALRSEAARPAREGARAELRRFSIALSLGADVDPEHALVGDLFATLESLRLASVASGEAARATATDPELAREARDLGSIRTQLNDFVAAGPEDDAAAEVWRAELMRLAEERDRAERGLRRKLAQAGGFAGGIDARTLGARLPEGTAAVSFLRYGWKFSRDRDTGERPPSVDSLLAFVVQPGGAVAQIDLGPATELETLVQDWRASLGQPLQGRGIAADEAAAPEERLAAAGRKMRERVIDPLLAHLHDVHALHVELDDVLHLVPLDALPLEEGLVGERIAIHHEVTLARLLREDAALEGERDLVLVGGLVYDAELGEDALVRLDACAPPLVLSSERSGPGAASFTSLPGTLVEAESISTLYERAFEREAVLFSGSGGTKAALVAAASKARFLHLATHGWFASEGFRSQLDTLSEQSSRASFERAEETLTGFAPETLCGLALAGANRGKDALGRVPGILTAEELATFDLRNCELAVLSACETNVGIRRAGQGIQSLQTALHAAGARTAITSLWKVDDAATRRLFELFYTKLWKEKLGKSDALWQAKMALRAEGHPPRDWAGWVLSGDPD